MTDYRPLIARAVEGLNNNTSDARRMLYERARAALAAQLRCIDPSLSEAEITRERLALEDAIHEVEAESTRKAHAEPGEPPLREPRVHINKSSSNEPPHGAEPPPSARSRLLSARTSERPPQHLTMFRKPADAADELDVVPPQTAARSRNAHKDYKDGYKDDQPHKKTGDHVERADYEQSPDPLEGGSAPVHELDPACDLDDQRRLEQQRPPLRQPLKPADQYREPPRSYRVHTQLVTVLVILLGVGTVIYWQWPNVNGLYQFLSHMRSRQSQTVQRQLGEPQFADGVPQDQAHPQAPRATPKSQSGPATAQPVVLYEEDPGNPQGKQFIGSATWRTETISPGSGVAPELQIRAELTIPERNITVTWSLRRNTDQALPASHTIEIIFKPPTAFPGGGVANVPAVRMKESEQDRGMPLAGVTVKVTNGFFLIGLSAIDTNVQQNMQLLKERPWFGIPIVYNNGERAILKLEKGRSGDRAFADAFVAWGN